MYATAYLFFKIPKVKNTESDYTKEKTPPTIGMDQMFDQNTSLDADLQRQIDENTITFGKSTSRKKI
jgi:hypothetical protein